MTISVKKNMLILIMINTLVDLERLVQCNTICCSNDLFENLSSIIVLTPFFSESGLCKDALICSFNSLFWSPGNRLHCFTSAVGSAPQNLQKLIRENSGKELHIKIFQP